MCSLLLKKPRFTACTKILFDTLYTYKSLPCCAPFCNDFREKYCTEPGKKKGKSCLTKLLSYTIMKASTTPMSIIRSSKKWELYKSKKKKKHWILKTENSTCSLWEYTNYLLLGEKQWKRKASLSFVLHPYVLYYEKKPPNPFI